MITPFSKGIQRESANSSNKLFTFNDYFQPFFATLIVASFLINLSNVFVCGNTG